MSRDVPRIGRDDVTVQLERLYRESRQHHLVAIFGAGERTMIDSESTGRFAVVPVRSELELRAELPPLDETEARIAYLVPWTGSVPLDIAGRFAKNGRVFRVGREERLLRMFGATSVEAGARRSPLADYLIVTAPDARFASPGGVLTENALWGHWLQTAWGLDAYCGLGLDTLLGWAAVNGKRAAFISAMEAPEAAGVREALLDFLGRRLGPAGPHTWRLWEQGEGRTVLELAVVFQTLVLDVEPTAEVLVWLRQKAKTELGLEEGEVVGIARSLGEAASGALRIVSRHADTRTRAEVIRAADGRLDDAAIRRAASPSRVLPSAWNDRLDALGEALSKGAAAPDTHGAEVAAARLRELENHEWFQESSQTTTVKRATMAARLLAWLASRKEHELVVSPTPFGEAEALGRWYTEEGGFVDWARRWARGETDSVLGRGAEAVVTAADAVRKELDQCFATSLAGWLEAGRPARQVLPIDAAVKKIVRPFLEGDPERRLLVLLMDGMAWSQAVELLESLGERNPPWGRLSWHSSKEGRLGEGHYPVVFAGFPTLTEVSRSAFFAGKTMKPGSKHRTEKDRERWRDNTDVARFFDGRDAPPLLLRDEGHTQAGAASPAALTMVGDPNRRVVAIVVNTIDDSLKANPGDRVAWTVDRIHALGDILDKAVESGRSVLFASDHGHVPVDVMKAVPVEGERGGARWRPWREGDVVADYEIALASDTVWSPRGAKGVVLLTDDTTCYGGTTHAGEHGGASLAEVVAPCLLIGCDPGQSAAEDAALTVTASAVPSWWHFDVPVAIPRAVKPVRKPPEPERQMVIPGVAEREPEPAPAPAPSAIATTFAASEILAAQTRTAKERREVASAVGFLVERNGIASADVFAQAMGEPSFRVRGLVSKLQEVLNLDGYTVIQYVTASNQVELNVGTLEELFEVKL